jgi:hypothetical protein
MARQEYRRRSPYAETGQTSWYLQRLNYRDVPADGTDMPMSVETKYVERPDLLSYDLYGTTDFWWIFAVRNPNVIEDPIFDLQAGVEIYVPTRVRIQELLG